MPRQEEMRSGGKKDFLLTVARKHARCLELEYSIHGVCLVATRAAVEQSAVLSREAPCG